MVTHFIAFAAGAGACIALQHYAPGVAAKLWSWALAIGAMVAAAASHFTSSGATP